MSKIKLFITFLFVVISYQNIRAQYKLSENQIVDGYNYLIREAGFKNPRSVQYNSSTISLFKFTKECFTWVRYDVSAQNGFGGFVRNEFYVYFFDGKPFLVLESGKYPAYSYSVNTDVAADYIIDLAASDLFGKPILESKFCPGEKKKLEDAEKKRKIELEDAEKKRKIERQKEIEEQEKKDKKIKKEINDFLKSKNTIINAAEKYSNLNFQDSSLYKKIYDSIQKYYGNEVIEISNVNLQKIIEINKYSLKNLNDGNYKILMNKEGELTISNNSVKLEDIYLLDFYEFESKNYHDFLIPLNSQAVIKISSLTVPKSNAIERLQTYDGCKITTNTFDKPYRIKFFNTRWWFYDNLKIEQTEKNTSLKKRDLISVKSHTINKYANSILIDSSKEADIILKKEKLHRRTLKVIWRSTFLSFSTFWISLYSYESSKIYN